MADVRWLTAFLDLAPDTHAAATEFWLGVTGASLSPARGEYDEFATLVPPDGDPYLRVQRLHTGRSGIHLDVHLPDQPFEAHTSPGGLSWCGVSGAESRRPGPASWPGGHRSQVDQVCVDIPADRYDEECEFWADLTGWPLDVDGVEDEFRRLRVPRDQPLKILLQRLDEPTGRVRAHLDLATDDRPAEVARHVNLGATAVGDGRGWTVLHDPAGSAYCVTDRPLDDIADAVVGGGR